MQKLIERVEKVRNPESSLWTKMNIVSEENYDFPNISSDNLPKNKIISWLLLTKSRQQILEKALEELSPASAK